MMQTTPRFVHNSAQYWHKPKISRDEGDRCLQFLFSSLLYAPSERSETGGYTVFTFVCLCVCLCALGSSYRLKAIKLRKSCKKFIWRIY